MVKSFVNRGKTNILSLRTSAHTGVAISILFLEFWKMPLPAMPHSRFIRRKQKTASSEDNAVYLPLWIRLHAQPCWNGGIWYKRTHGTEYR